MSKLRFNVVYFSGEDPEYPAEELNIHSPHTRGWQSPRFCEYPCEIGFELEPGDARISQVQILSHQSKISTKIEIFVGQGTSYHTASFKRLGYLSLDSNERSSFQARELKTVYLDHIGRYVRFLVHQCYTNKYNMFNQVGIVAVNILGVDESPLGAKQLQRGDNAPGAKAYPQMSNNPLNDLSVDLNLDPQTAVKLRNLSEAKSRAVASEDYAMAKQIKAVEGELRTLGSRLAQLDIAKRQAVGMEDYDRAKELKDEMDDVRGEIEHMVREIRIPGVTDNRPIPLAQRANSYQSHQPAFKEDMDMSHLEAASPPINSARGKSGKVPAIPLNIDDLPVGPGVGGMSGIGGMGNEFKSKSPRRPKPEIFDDVGDLGDRDRPIRPTKGGGSAGYTYEDDAVGPGMGGAMGGGGDDDEKFAPGEHPLEGIPNLGDLPNPEGWAGKSK